MFKALFLEVFCHLSASFSIFFDIHMPSDHVFLFSSDLMTSLHFFPSPHSTIIVQDLKIHRWTLQCPSSQFMDGSTSSDPQLLSNSLMQSHTWNPHYLTYLYHWWSFKLRKFSVSTTSYLFNNLSISQGMCSSTLLSPLVLCCPL